MICKETLKEALKLIIAAQDKIDSIPVEDGGRKEVDLAHISCGLYDAGGVVIELIGDE